MPLQPTEKETFQKEDYVVVHYDKLYFPGVIIEVVTANNGKITQLKVNAMERVGKKLKWPEKKDEIFYKIKDVTKKVDPKTVTPYTNRGTFHVKDEFLVEK